MAVRDKARSDLYLAQLKLQSAPNTPGLPTGGVLSPRDGGWVPPQGYYAYNTEKSMEAGEAGYEDENTQYLTVNEKKKPAVTPFSLQAPPKKSARTDSAPSSPLMTPTGLAASRHNDHVPAADGEAQYETVAIPGAYASPSTPAFPPQALQNAGFDFGIDSRINKK
jgi:hypothetical protein